MTFQNYDENEHFQNIHTAVTELLSIIDTNYGIAQSDTQQNYLSFGIKELDKEAIGIPHQGLTVITSKKKQPQQILSAKIIIQNAMTDNKNVVVVSPPQDIKSFTFRLISHLSAVELNRFYKGLMDDDEWRRYETSFTKLPYNIDFFVDPYVTTDSLCNEIYERKEKTQAVDLIVINDLSFIDRDIYKATLKLSLFAKKNNISIVALHCYGSKKEIVENGLFAHSDLLLTIKKKHNKFKINVLKNALSDDDGQFKLI